MKEEPPELAPGRSKCGNKIEDQNANVDSGYECGRVSTVRRSYHECGGIPTARFYCTSPNKRAMSSSSVDVFILVVTGGNAQWLHSAKPGGQSWTTSWSIESPCHHDVIKLSSRLTPSWSCSVFSRNLSTSPTQHERVFLSVLALCFAT